MPQRQNWNTKFPRTRSSSSVSLNESPITDDINYDSDISEDEHAIAEDADDDEEDEDYDGETGRDDQNENQEGFEVEVKTLTGNTFSVMIQPQDTLEVLKTRIAFQEGISPADQNLVLEQGKLLDNAGNNTVEELNITPNSRLTLVANVTSGVPFKNLDGTLLPGEDGINDLSSNRNHLWGTSRLNSITNPGESHRLAPTIKRNYGSNDNGNAVNCLNQPQSSNFRLPKITGSSRCNIDKNIPEGNDLEGNANREKKVSNYDTLQERLDEREWMQSLFNKVAEQEEQGMEENIQNGMNPVFGVGDSGNGAENDDDEDIDSTTGRMDSTLTSGFPDLSSKTRFGKKGYVERSEVEDGNIFVVQGDDGVILIIQKSAGQVESGNEEEDDTYSIDLGVHSGRIPAMGRYSYDCDKPRKKGSESVSSVHERIRENAVTLEKMRQVRSMMTLKNQQKSEAKSKSNAEKKNFEFPKIPSNNNNAGVGGGNGLGSNLKRGIGYTVHGGKHSGNRSASHRVNGALSRSINSSKMSLNRLIAEIYLQSKRKGYSFQPGQPPYTEQQLLRYVQLKVAILLEEQRKNKTEPCSKCVLDSDWSYNEVKSYLTPTVVMNRYKKRLNNSKSLELDNDDDDIQETLNDPNVHMTMTLPVQRRKSIIPGTRKTSNGHIFPSQIPRLIPGERNVTATATTSTSNSTLSRRSSQSVPPPLDNPGGTMIPPIVRSSKGSRSTNQYIFFNSDGLNPINCDSPSIINGNHNGQTIYFGNGKRPSLKIHQRIYAPNSNGTTAGRGLGVGYSSKRPSRPDSAIKNAANKKGAVRCPVCKKKIGIACRYQCRCGLVFCSTHRYPEAHECPFDYKTEGRNKIKEDNPVIVAQKIQHL